VSNREVGAQRQAAEPSPTERSVCSNRAATQANNLKTREKLRSENTLICRDFANSRNLLQSVMLL
jgi:hypothetical protein